MNQLNQVTYREIERLDQFQLTELLLMLLTSEAEENSLLTAGIAVSLKIEVSDGGEDGRIKWDGGPARTDSIPDRFTIFQCKATDMPPAKCKSEMCKKDSKDLKVRVKEVLDAGGTYVLFYGRECNPQHCQPRIEEIRAAIRESGAHYADRAKIEIYDAQRIANWCNRFAAAVAYVCEKTGFQLPLGLKTWAVWAKHPDHQIQFFSNQTLDALIVQLRTAVAQPRAVVRVEGLSGLGKTRLVLEAFRTSIIDISVKALQDSLIYCNASLLGKEIVAFASDLANRGIRGVLIVDDCPAALHKLLAAESGRIDSRLRLVTIDYVPTRAGHLDTPLIRLEPRHFDDVVKSLLRHSYPDLKAGDLERIAQFAQGFPQMAVLLAKARKQGDANLGALHDEDLLEKLLWGREAPDTTARKVIETCAIFESVGLVGNASVERDFVAKEICGIESADFYGICQKFIERGICQTGGDYAQVVPKPLALRLAAEWWRKRPPDSVPALLANLADNRLGQALCDQMAKLDFLPQARELTKELCGERGPFGKAEVLSSNEGSRLFRSLVEVNPQAGAHALRNAFDERTLNELRSVVGPTRRNLVWALEKVCFWAETFPIAAPILLSFAAAENETWANNATGQFLQLFHILLPGTKASLQQRMQVLRDGLATEHVEKRRLAIRALGSALQTWHFSRMAGVESQGSRAPEEDYQPMRAEVAEYWREVMKLLVGIAEGDGELPSLAREQIAEAMRGQLNHGFFDEVESAVRHISTKHGPWSEARTAINDSLEFEGAGFPTQVRERLKNLAESLLPVELVDRLRLQISIPEWEHQKREDGQYLDISQARAEALADELAAKGTAWFEHLPLIFQGDQRQGFSFGQRLATRAADPLPFIEAALSTLRRIPHENRNCIVLAGFLAGLPNRQIVTSVLETIEKDPILSVELVELTRLTKPTREDLGRLIGLLQRGTVAVDRFQSFAYGSVLDHLPAQDVIYFCESLSGISSSETVYGFYILYMYCVHRKERWEQCKGVFRALLSEEGVIDRIHKNTMLAHAWKETVANLLASEPKDEKFASLVANEIVKSASGKEFSYSADHYITPTLSILFDRYFQSTWPVIGAALISDDWMTRRHLTHVLGDLSDKDVGASLIASFPVDFLRNWCEQNRPNASHILARVTPVIVRKDSSLQWHPVAKMLLDAFGEDEEMLSELSANWGSFSWTGSLIPYYEQQLALIRQLANHPIPAVRKWQVQSAEWVLQRIEFEQKREAEAQLGIR